MRIMQSMLSTLDIKGAVISADAMHCQTETAKVIRANNADYSLQVKNNQGNLLKEIKAYFHKTYRDKPNLFEDNHFSETGSKHGRINQKNYRLLAIGARFDETKKWPDSFAVVEVERIRTFKTDPT